VRFPGEGLIEIVYSVSRAILAALLILFGVGLIQKILPNAFPEGVKFVEHVVRLTSDEHVSAFVGDRVLVFGVVGVASVLWVTHKWPTLIKTVGQALNPFARIGVATVSAIAAVLVALILAGPLGQSRTKGECESSFHLTVNNAPSLVSNTKCGGGDRDSGN
jgi:hypothetical protein